MKGCFDLRVASKTSQIFVNVSLSVFHSGLEYLLILSKGYNVVLGLHTMRNLSGKKINIAAVNISKSRTTNCVNS